MTNFKIVFKTKDDTLALTQCRDEEHFEVLVDRKIIPNTSQMIRFDNQDTKTLCEQDPNMEFFECWQFDKSEYPTKITVDIDKAQVIWTDHLRQVRNNRLDRLDKKLIIALGKNDTAEIERLNDLKESLKDLPEHIDYTGVKSITDLKDVFPAILMAE